MLLQTEVVTAAWANEQDARLWLTEREQEQMEAFSSAGRRADWLAGRLAVKRMVRQQWDINPLAYEIGTNGVAPMLVGKSLPAVNISLSHCNGAGAASWCEPARGTVGIDIQRVRPVRGGFAERILSAHEHAQWETKPNVRFLLLFWALKEAAIKACRRPYRRALCEINVSLLTNGAASVVMPDAHCLLSAEYEWADGAWLARAVLPANVPPAPQSWPLFEGPQQRGEGEEIR